MNKTHRISVAALSAVCMVAGNASAQDQSFDWSGFYAGIHIDGSVFSAESSDLTDIFTNDAPSQSILVFGGGLSAGYNYQLSPNVIIGAELDYTSQMRDEFTVATNADGSEGTEYFNGWDDIISLRARVGLVQDRAMFFFAGGPAMASANYQVRNFSDSATNCANSQCAAFEESLLGVAVGGGAEFAFKDNIIGKFEIIHYEMETAETEVLNSGNPACSGGSSAGCVAFTESSATSLRLGVNYKF